MIPISHYLFLSTALMTIGVLGVLTRRNMVIILMSVELILNAVNINLVAFSHYWGGVHGRGFMGGWVPCWDRGLSQDSGNRGSTCCSSVLSK